MKFQVPGKPQALQRHRSARYGGMYDPSAKYKHYVGQLALVAKAEARSDHLKGDLMACMTFYIADLKRRDLDNMIKLILDAVNKILYDDDSQVVRILASKQPCAIRDERTEVEIFPIKL